MRVCDVEPRARGRAFWAWILLGRGRVPVGMRIVKDTEYETMGSSWHWQCARVQPDNCSTSVSIPLPEHTETSALPMLYARVPLMYTPAQVRGYSYPWLSRMYSPSDFIDFDLGAELCLQR